MEMSFEDEDEENKVEDECIFCRIKKYEKQYSNII